MNHSRTFFGLLALMASELAVGQTTPAQTVKKNLAAPAQNRKVNHLEAYKAHPERGPHIDLKITPPEKRGKDTMVLVEIYNRSKLRISVLKFDITFKNRGAQDVAASIEAEDLGPGWSVPRWVKIPASGKIPTIDSIILTNVRVIDSTANEVKLKAYSDLIKE